jgi:hypothetical protein
MLPILILVVAAVLVLIFVPEVKDYFFKDKEPATVDYSDRGYQPEPAVPEDDCQSGGPGCPEEEGHDSDDEAPALLPLPKDAPAEYEEEEEEQDILAVRVGPPSEINDVKDLKGCWEVKEGFVNNFGARILHRYCFDESGNATSYSAYLASDGKVNMDCNNTATASMDGNGFILKGKNPPPCPGWSAGTYSCKLVDKGVIRCELNHNGSVDQTDFYYKEE